LFTDVKLTRQVLPSQTHRRKGYNKVKWHFRG